MPKLWVVESRICGAGIAIWLVNKGFWGVGLAFQAKMISCVCAGLVIGRVMDL